MCETPDNFFEVACDGDQILTPIQLLLIDLAVAVRVEVSINAPVAVCPGFAFLCFCREGDFEFVVLACLDERPFELELGIID